MASGWAIGKEVLVDMVLMIAIATLFFSAGIFGMVMGLRQDVRKLAETVSEVRRQVGGLS